MDGLWKRRSLRERRERDVQKELAQGACIGRVTLTSRPQSVHRPVFAANRALLRQFARWPHANKISVALVLIGCSGSTLLRARLQRCIAQPTEQ